MTDNELIAEFMKLDKHPNNQRAYWIEDQDCYLTFDNLQFHKSWNQLMPVVEKISQHVYESWTDSNGYTDVIHYERAYPRTFGMIDSDGRWLVRINRMPLEQENTLIQATYQAVIEWIKLYNEKAWYEQ